MREQHVSIQAPKRSSEPLALKAIQAAARQPGFTAALHRCRPGLRTALAIPTHTQPLKHVTGSPHTKPPGKVPAALTHALRSFTLCMRAHGVSAYPEPQGAGFNITHANLDENSPQFKAASAACAPILRAAMRTLPAGR